MFRISRIEFRISQSWSKHGPFALHHADRWTKAYSDKDTRIAMEGLMGALMTPVVHMGYLHQTDHPHPDIVVTCHTPGFKPEVSKLLVHVSAQGTYLRDPLDGRLKQQLDAYDQSMETPYRIEQVEDERSGQIACTRLFYKGKGPVGHYRWRTRVRHVADWGIITPPLLGEKDNYDPNAIAHGRINLLVVGLTYKSQKPGWVYAELWLDDDKETA